MSNDPKESQQPYNAEALKRTRVGQLFGLCEVWVAGRLTDEVFSRQTLELRRSLLNQEWPDPTDPLLRQFNLAVQAVVAIEQTIADLKLFAQTSDPPLAMRAYYFGGRVSGEAVLALETALRPGDPEPAGPPSPLTSRFGREP